MEFNQKQYEEIEAFLLSQMPPEEMEAFQARVATETSLHKEVAIHRTMVEGIEECALEDEISLLFDELQAEEKQEGKITPLIPHDAKMVQFPSTTRSYLVAAVISLLVLAVAGYIILKGPQSVEPNIVFSEDVTEEALEDVEPSKQISIQSEALASLSNNQDSKAEAVWIFSDGNSVVLSAQKPETHPSETITLFQADQRIGVAPFEVSFQSSLKNVSEYLWDFGDDSQVQTISPTYVYTKAGKYTVTLVITDKQGNKDTLSIPEFITVLPSGEDP